MAELNLVEGNPYSGIHLQVGQRAERSCTVAGANSGAGAKLGINRDREGCHFGVLVVLHHLGQVQLLGTRERWVLLAALHQCQARKSRRSNPIGFGRSNFNLSDETIAGQEGRSAVQCSHTVGRIVDDSIKP